MPADINDLRRRLVDPHRLCSDLGLIDGPRSFRRQSRGLTIRCPWHAERTPSCSVRVGPDGTIAVKCMACGASADALGLIAQANGLSTRGPEFTKVAAIAAMMAGLEDTGTFSTPPPPPMPPEPARCSDDAFAAIGDVLALECPLTSEPDACRYLEDRGLLEAAGGTLWALPGTDEGLERVRQAIIDTVGLEAWQTSGLATSPGYWHCPHHRLCIPWRAPDGATLTIQRRLLWDGKPKYVFPPRRPPRWPFGAEDLVDFLGPATEVCLVEGALDVLAMRTIANRDGLDRVVLGLPGVSSWSKPWAHLAAGRVAIVALDADGAGQRPFGGIREDLLVAGAIRVDREIPADGSNDWAEVLMKRAS